MPEPEFQMTRTPEEQEGFSSEKGLAYVYLNQV